MQTDSSQVIVDFQKERKIREVTKILKEKASDEYVNGLLESLRYRFFLPTTQNHTNYLTDHKY